LLTKAVNYYLLAATVLALAFSCGCANQQHDPDNNPRLRLNAIGHDEKTAADVKKEISFGRNVAGRVLSRYQLSQNSPLNQYINLIGTSLTANAARTELQFYFAVIESNQVNAYSAPGGYIFITTGAIQAANNEAELAGILAHEIAHVTERHIVNALNIRDVSEDSSAAIGKMIRAGGESARVAFSQVVDKAMAILFESGFNQRDEFESDRVGTLLLAMAGYDAQALKNFLHRTHQQTHTKHHRNSTHPTSTDRLAALDTFIAEEQLTNLDGVRNQQRFKQHVNQ